MCVSRGHDGVLVFDERNQESQLINTSFWRSTVTDSLNLLLILYLGILTTHLVLFMIRLSTILLIFSVQP